jgi:hypothetical protein
LTGAGLEIAYDNDDPAARARPGRSLFLMQEPVNARGLTLRKTYVYLFWYIEKQAARWDWPVAQEPFEVGVKDTQKAALFCRSGGNACLTTKRMRFAATGLSMFLCKTSFCASDPFKPAARLK